DRSTPGARLMMNSGPVRDGATHAASAPDQTGAQAPLLKLDDFLPHRLNVLSSLVSQALTRVYGRHGIGIPEWRAARTPRPRPPRPDGRGARRGWWRPPPQAQAQGPAGGGAAGAPKFSRSACHARGSARTFSLAGAGRPRDL